MNLMFGQSKAAIAAAIAHDRYLVQSRAIGVSPDVAEAELKSVRAEVFGAGDVYEIAWRRLIAGGPAYRPSDQIRAALRANYPHAHPEQIDRMALAVAPDETLAKELLSQEIDD